MYLERQGKKFIDVHYKGFIRVKKEEKFTWQGESRRGKEVHMCIMDLALNCEVDSYYK